MVASGKVDLEMRRISGKLNEHFAFLNANGAMIAYIVYTLGIYVSDFVWKITVRLISAVFVVLDFLKNCSNLID